MLCSSVVQVRTPVAVFKASQSYRFCGTRVSLSGGVLPEMCERCVFNTHKQQQRAQVVLFGCGVLLWWLPVWLILLQNSNHPCSHSRQRGSPDFRFMSTTCGRFTENLNKNDVSRWPGSAQTEAPDLRSSGLPAWTPLSERARWSRSQRLKQRISQPSQIQSRQLWMKPCNERHKARKAPVLPHQNPDTCLHGGKAHPEPSGK